MGDRIRFRIKSFFKRWYLWIWQLFLYVLFIIRDEYATRIIFKLGDKNWGKMVEVLLSFVPKNASGWGLLILCLSVISILIYDFFDTKEFRELKLQAQAIGTVKNRNNQDMEREAYIQVTNTGNKEFTCIAQLVKVARKPLRGRNYKEIDVNELNPVGNFLGWGKNGIDHTVLFPRVPKTIVLMRSHRNYRALAHRDEMCFMFPGYEKDLPPIEFGYYTIQVDFYYLDLENNKDKKFFTFDGKLKVDRNELKWI